MFLTNAGDQEYEKVEVNVRDIVKIHIYEIGIFIGTVEAVTKDFISLRNTKLLKSINPDTTMYIRKETIFYTDEIYRLSVVGERCSKKGLSPLVTEKFNEKESLSWLV